MHVNSSGPKSPPALIFIKAIHSLAFLAELTAIGWLLLSGLLGRRDRSVSVAAALVAAESGVFLANRGVCPLTPLAERHGAARGSVSDIFLPDVVARTIPIWATTLVAIAAALHARGAWRTWQRSSALQVPRSGGGEEQR
jgi:hypothetical protein